MLLLRRRQSGDITLTSGTIVNDLVGKDVAVNAEVISADLTCIPPTLTDAALVLLATLRLPTTASSSSCRALALALVLRLIIAGASIGCLRL